MRAPVNQGSFKSVPLPAPSTAVATCMSLIDIGTIENNYQGKVDGTVRKIFITWELPEYTAVFNDEKGPQPFVVSKELTLSFGDKANLPKLIAQWRNRPLSETEKTTFDPTVMVGKTAMVSFIHKRKAAFAGQDLADSEISNANTNLSFNGIMPIPPSVQKPTPVNEQLIWDWDAIEDSKVFPMEDFKKVPKFIRTKMRTSKEFLRLAPPEAYQEDGDAPAAAPQAQTTQQPQAQQAPPAGPVVEDEGGW